MVKFEHIKKTLCAPRGNQNVPGWKIHDLKWRYVEVYSWENCRNKSVNGGISSNSWSWLPEGTWKNPRIQWSIDQSLLSRLNKHWDPDLQFFLGPKHLWHSTGDPVFALQDAEEEDEGWQGWKDGYLVDLNGWWTNNILDISSKHHHFKKEHIQHSPSHFRKKL